MRLNELKNLETEIGHKIKALKQINSHIEYLKDQVIIKIKRIKKKSKNLSIEKPFDFTEQDGKQKEENEIDLDLFFELAEENKVI